MRKGLFIAAKITKVLTLDPGEIRIIQLTLPKEFELDHVLYPVRDRMRPGTAFLTKTFGARTQKLRRRMYTRSNSSTSAELQLETVINYTHLGKADTSLWWQSEEVIAHQQRGEPIEVRVDWNEAHSAFEVYENSHICEPTNLRLEPDGEWEGMKFVGIAFATGITPFLSYLRYMRERQFGRHHDSMGADFTLIASARAERQLIAHEELLELERQFPLNFHYHPVLTREWPPDWPYTKGRIIRVSATEAPSPRVDLSRLLDVVPDIDRCHLRMCGNQGARDQLQQGIAQWGVSPLSFRAEVW
jgi:hypothetical protein